MSWLVDPKAKKIELLQLCKFLTEVESIFLLADATSTFALSERAPH